jgi:hypothetical protein
MTMTAWNERSESERATIVAALVEIAAAQLSEDAHPWYPGAAQTKPRVEVYAATRDGNRWTVSFVADHLIYNFAQSGSDWADHYVLAGDAVFEDDRKIAESVAVVDQRHVREYDYDYYEPKRLVAEMLAKLTTS